MTVFFALLGLSVLPCHKRTCTEETSFGLNYS